MKMNTALATDKNANISMCNILTKWELYKKPILDTVVFTHTDYSYGHHRKHNKNGFWGTWKHNKIPIHICEICFKITMFSKIYHFYNLFFMIKIFLWFLYIIRVQKVKREKINYRKSLKKFLVLFEYLVEFLYSVMLNFKLENWFSFLFEFFILTINITLFQIVLK